MVQACASPRAATSNAIMARTNTIVPYDCLELLLSWTYVPSGWTWRCSAVQVFMGICKQFTDFTLSWRHKWKTSVRYIKYIYKACLNKILSPLRVMLWNQRTFWSLLVTLFTVKRSRPPHDQVGQRPRDPHHHLESPLIWPTRSCDGLDLFKVNKATRSDQHVCHFKAWLRGENIFL